MAAAALMLAACGRDGETSGARATSVGARSVTQPTTSRRTPEPVKLVAGPLVFRITGAPKPTSTNLTEPLLYVMVFRLSREPNLKVSSYVLPQRRISTQVGNYAIVDDEHGWNEENNIGVFGRRKDHCFSGYFSTSTTFPEFDAIRLGQPVRVTLRPGTLRRDGTHVVLGKEYVRYPRLRHIDYQVMNKRSRQALKRIGCPANEL